MLRAEDPEPDPHDAVREAYMRKVLRRTVRDGYQRIAVVCGAWHVPALTDLPPAAADDRLLRGLPKVKAVAHLDPVDLRPPRLRLGLRGRHPLPRLVRPSVRLGRTASRALAGQGRRGAARRGRPGIVRARDRVGPARRGAGRAARAAAGRARGSYRGGPRRAVRGQRPAHRAHPAAPGRRRPARRSARRHARWCRCSGICTISSAACGCARRPRPATWTWTFASRTDLARSRLLHRLALLAVRWGTPQPGRTANIGTFRESWQLTWRPELDLALIEASIWGSTVAAARHAASPRAGRRGHACRT